MEYKNIIYSEEGKIGRITLNRPEKRNALSLEMLNEIDDLLHKIAKERKVHCVIIKGAGKVFSAGHDFNDIFNRKPLDVEKLFLQCFKVMRSIRDLPQPVIAQVHGIATAAGCQLVAACDLAVAEENALFATPGIKRGSFCATPIVFVSRNIGRKRAFEMGFTGDYITAKQALEWGLINKVVPMEKLEEAVNELAEKIASYSLTALEIGKRMFYQQLNMDDLSALHYASEIITLIITGEESQRTMKAFLEGKPMKLD
ncbi:MAG: enoyl-CoA hydratase-related protein [Nitrososphaerales archaeon]